MKIKMLVTVAYGLTAIGVGIWRHLQTGDSPQAAWFGVVMGSVAIAGALLLSLRNRLPGYLLIVLSLCFVGAWFLRRLLTGHPDGTSVRVIIMLMMWAIEVGILLPRPPAKRNP